MVCGVLCAATQLLAPGAAAQTLTTIHTFTGGPNDGANPASPLLISASGRLYGVTWYGGLPNCFYACGTVFSLAPPSSPGGAWRESVYDFQGVTSVEYPTGLTASGGILYGTSWEGGSFGYGTVFALTSVGHTITAQVLHSFADSPDGALPSTGVVAGSVGPSGLPVLYGTTYYGGIEGGYSGCGTVFSLTPPPTPGAAWAETILHSFGGDLEGGIDGCFPQDLAIDAAGVLYGVTFSAGEPDAGIVFSLSPPSSPGGSWTETVLYNFSGRADGSNPAHIAISSSGRLYVTTVAGGKSGYGTIVALTPPATAGGSWHVAHIHPFAGGPTDGAYPGAMVTRGGVLYGVTAGGGTDGGGVVYSLTPPSSPGGTWTERVLHSFPSGENAYPPTSLAVDSTGVLYGTTSPGNGPQLAGCAGGCGTVFSLTP